MNSWITIAQIILAVAMIDVWLVRYNRPGFFRGGNATTMSEEFRVYGLPDWLRHTVRVLKLCCGGAMIVGLWAPVVAAFGASLLVLLMTGAAVMHLKVKDPWYKAFPATLFLAVAAITAAFHWPAS